MNFLKSLAIAAVAASALSIPLSQATTHSTAPDKELLEYNDTYNEIAGNYDIDAFLALYNDSPLWIAPGEAPVSGLEVPRATFEFFSSNDGSLLHSAEHSFVSQDGTQAVLIGRYDLEVDKAGVKGSGTYLLVLEKSEGQWDIVVDMYNQHEKR